MELNRFQRRKYVMVIGGVAVKSRSTLADIEVGKEA
jgi:hypothetical protein